MEASDQTHNEQAPVAEQPQTSEQLLTQLLEAQQQHRDELAAMRRELDAERSRRPAPGPSATPVDPATLQRERLEQVAEHSHYCPGCGRLYDYPQRCQGGREAPHPPIEVVSTDELKNPPNPDDRDAYAEWQAGHTAPEYVTV